MEGNFVCGFNKHERMDAINSPWADAMKSETNPPEMMPKLPPTIDANAIQDATGESGKYCSKYNLAL